MYRIDKLLTVKLLLNVHCIIAPFASTSFRDVESKEGPRCDTTQYYLLVIMTTAGYSTGKSYSDNTTVHDIN